MIVYISRTGNVKYIVSKLNLPSCEITHDLVMNKPYILFTYTDGLGDIPKNVVDFLNNRINQENIKGIIASGNTNFGKDLFCKVADTISISLNIPIIRKIDLRGTKEDIAIIKDQYYKIIEGEV